MLMVCVWLVIFGLNGCSYGLEVVRDLVRCGFLVVSVFLLEEWDLGFCHAP